MASFSIPAGDSWQKCDNFPLSVWKIVCLYCHSVYLQPSLVVFHTHVVHQQLHHSHTCSKLFILHVFLACYSPIQITQPGSIELIQYRPNGYPRPLTWKIKNKKNLEHENFIYSTSWLPLLEVKRVTSQLDLALSEEKRVLLMFALNAVVIIREKERKYEN